MVYEAIFSISFGEAATLENSVLLPMKDKPAWPPPLMEFWREVLAKLGCRPPARGERKDVSCMPPLTFT